MININKLTEGTEFYYTNKGLGKPEKSEVLKIEYSLPLKTITKSKENNRIFKCYNGFGCYVLNEYDAGLKEIGRFIQNNFNYDILIMTFFKCITLKLFRCYYDIYKLRFIIMYYGK